MKNKKVDRSENRTTMEEKNALEAPPPTKPTTVGVVYNLKKGIHTEAVDSEAEYDHIETVYGIQQALEKGGLNVVLLEADRDLPDKLQTTNIDIAFNIAEGFTGRGREAQIPALLNMMGIPFTGSDETTLCLALDKTLTKRLLNTYHITSPKSLEAPPGGAIHLSNIKFPVIVKPNAEGSSKGISNISVIENKTDLSAALKKNFELYQENMIIEEYVEGREFTVGILGNGKDTHVFSPMEIIFQRPTQGDYHVYSFSVKQEYKKFVKYSCPPELPEETLHEMTQTARKVYEIMNCHDFARMDFRLSKTGKLYFIEINPLPGLAPEYSDYPMLAAFCGMPYDTLVLEILKAAAKRLNIKLHN